MLLLPLFGMILVYTLVVLLFIPLAIWYKKQRFKAQHSTLSNYLLGILGKLQIIFFKTSLEGCWCFSWICDIARLINHSFNNKDWGQRGRPALYCSRTLQVPVLWWDFFNLNKKAIAKKENISSFLLAKIKYVRELS